jgi:hypothetical protein
MKTPSLLIAMQATKTNFLAELERVAARRAFHC